MLTSTVAAALPSKRIGAQLASTHDLSVYVLQTQLVQYVTVRGKVLPPHVHEHPPPPVEHELQVPADDPDPDPGCGQEQSIVNQSRSLRMIQIRIRGVAKSSQAIVNPI